MRHRSLPRDRVYPGIPSSIQPGCIPPTRVYPFIHPTRGGAPSIHPGLDFNDDHNIYFSDFVTAVVCHKIDTGSDQLIKATFDRFDVDNSGQISLQNLQNLFGAQFRNVKVEDMLAEADLDGNQLIDFTECKNFVLKKNKLKGSK